MASRLVLLADDDAVNRAIVRHFLAPLPGVELVEAGNGREALTLALERRFDLLIVDQNMPHIPGDRLVRYLRASPNPNTDTPVIRFTAEGAVQPIAGGVEVFLAKPVQGEPFRETVARCLGLDPGGASDGVPPDGPVSGTFAPGSAAARR